ncbi:MAG: two-component regulator propeller domain-containing protein [Deltaproteobacteria bacterium]|nr:two-component regulator propeller domain-containing protein [Deltaproteobacteria bacterium]
MNGLGWIQRVAALLWPLLVVQPVCAAAVLSASPLDFYRVERWGVQDDLPSTAVQSLAWDRAGHLVLGLHGDVMRFDGVRFRSLGLGPSLAERTQVRALMIDHAGGLWASTLNRGLFYRATDQFARFGVAQGLFPLNIASVCQSPDNHVWIGTTQGLWEADGARLRKVDAGAVSRLACAADGSVWVAPGERALWRWRDGQRTGFAAETAMTKDGAYSVLSTANHGVWVGTNAGALIHIVGDKLERIGVPEGVPAVRITALAEDMQAQLWFGTWGGGVGVLQSPQKVAMLDVTAGLAGNTVTALAADDLGTMWVGTTSGLSRLSPRPFRIVDQRHGLPSAFTTALFQGADGDVWLGGEDGLLMRVSPSGAARTERVDAANEPGSHSPVLALNQDSAGRLLIGTGDQLWRRSLPESPHVPVPGLSGGATGVTPVWGMTATTSDGLWLNLGGRLGRLSEGELHLVDSKHASGLIATTPLQTKDGQLRVGANGCIYRVQGDSLVQELRLPVSEDALVYGLVETPLGLWAGTREGLVHVRGTHAEKIGVSAGLLGSVTALVEDAQGDVWAASRAGLFRVRFENGRWQVRRWHAAWGLQSTEFSFPASPSAFRMQSGELWFSTNAGVVVVDPKRVTPPLAPPSTVIEKLTAEGHVIAPASQVTLPPGTGRLDVEFTALRTLEPRLCQFRFQLQGIDEGWVVLARERGASFTNLAPRLYHLAVQAAGPDGVWGPITRMQILLPPLWYQRTTVRLLALVVVLAGLTTLVSVLRVRHVKRRFETLADERQRISRDLHDALEQGLTGIALHLKAIEQRTQPADPGRPHVDAARAIVSHIRSDTRHFIWDLRRQPAQGLVGALQAAAAYYRALEVGTCTVSIRGPEPQASAETLTAVLRIVQESLTNAAKHAAAPHVTIDLDANPAGGFVVRIADNGQGFELDQHGHGRLGLQGMRERATRVGGQLEFHTAPGQGTEVILRIPSTQGAKT